MKKYGTLIALAIAVVFGIVAVILANKYLSSKVGEETVVIKEQVPLTQVVIAGKDLEIGSMLSEENLAIADWPKANAPKGAFGKIEDVVGRVTVTKMVAGTPVVAAELAGEGSGVGLVAMIDPGMRAMSIRVDEVIGVGGFILPNTFVDIISVESSGKSRDAKTILKRIEVMAVAQETFVEEGKAKLVKTVTLELTPKQAETLAETINKNPIHLVLRNPLDIEEQQKTEPKKEPEKVAKVVTKRAYKPKPKPATYDIVVIRGTKSVENVKLPAGN